jgi:hypothetical protein
MTQSDARILEHAINVTLTVDQSGKHVTGHVISGEQVRRSTINESNKTDMENKTNGYVIGLCDGNSIFYTARHRKF